MLLNFKLLLLLRREPTREAVVGGGTEATANCDGDGDGDCDCDLD